ncbi:MAG: DUF523 domain-containing protein [Mailhella sp.]|nr:DUF523 domain-containing protein [Mailhella sp.]
MNDRRGRCRCVVSACLAGEECRYDGRSNLRPEIAGLVADGIAVPVCPEVLGGLPTPRIPSEIRGAGVFTSGGHDVTEAFTAGAREALRRARAAGCDTAILKARSPSCGCGRIYDGTFSRVLIPGDGIFAAMLRAEGFRLLTEEDITPDVLRGLA